MTMDQAENQAISFYCLSALLHCNIDSFRKFAFTKDPICTGLLNFHFSNGGAKKKRWQRWQAVTTSFYVCSILRQLIWQFDNLIIKVGL